MQAYILKRLLLFVPTLLLVTLMVFALMRVLPGDPALLLLVGDTGEGQYTQDQLENLQSRLGTDRNVVVQYADWVRGMLRLDFGTSMFYDTAISDDIKKKLPITLELTVVGMLLAAGCALPLGVLSAVKQDSISDYVARLIAIAGVALPTFWVGIMMVFLLVKLFGWLPPLGYVDLWDDPLKNLQQIIFPAISLGIYNMAFIARVTRSSMLEVSREDYIRTARSKGLGETVVIIRHTVRNALLPVITISGWQFARLLGGTVIIESIFLVPGMGRLLIDSIFHRDYTMIQAIVVVITLMVMVMNLIVDVAYGWLDPRIRYQ